MCEYIKDDGEQCRIDTHDGPFCHQHEDTRYAELWRIVKGLTVDESGSRYSEMETTCNNCEGRLRRRERLTEHPNQTRRKVFEAYVECDCGELVLGSTSVSNQKLPSGWSA